MWHLLEHRRLASTSNIGGVCQSHTVCSFCCFYVHLFLASVAVELDADCAFSSCYVLRRSSAIRARSSCFLLSSYVPASRIPERWAERTRFLRPPSSSTITSVPLLQSFIQLTKRLNLPSFSPVSFDALIPPPFN